MNQQGKHMFNKLITAIVITLLLLIAVISLPINAEPLVAKVDNFQLSIGEVPHWDSPDLASNNGDEFFTAINERTFNDVFWVRWQFDISDGALPEKDMVLRARTLGAYQTFWDDKLIGSNGIASASKQREVPGEIEKEFLLPNSWLTLGKHTNSFKFSSHHRQSGHPLISWVNINEFTSNTRYFSLGSLIPTLLVSIALMIGVYFFTLFMSEKDNKAYLIFSILCFDLFIFGLALQWPHMVGYTYDWYLVNNSIGFITGALFPMFLPLFFLFKYQLVRYWPVILFLPLSATILVNIDGGRIAYWAIGLVMSIAIVAYVVKRERGRYWWELLGLVICLLGVINGNTDLEDFFYFFPLLVLFILVSNAIEARQQKQASFRFKLKSSQLEAQLLRKNIQPHFILNSLASLVEWVETAPDKSVEFISALADEFRLFAEVSGKELIAIDKEVMLCRQHLAIMTFRLQRKFTLTYQGFDDRDTLPPGIIHTLIENAFSHNDYSKTNVEFSLEKQQMGQQYCITFNAPIVQADESRFEHLGTGTGLNFIHSQMTQSYGDKWQIEQNKQGENWQTTLRYFDFKGSK